MPTLYMCGALFLFDDVSINAQYGLSEDFDEHADFVKTISPKCLAQECAVHQLINEITKSDSDDDKKEVPINQFKRKRFKKATGKTVHADSND
ncbi:hypothetical protein PVK06_047916 [Gossypium arboreum]|uniref:Uncharacterized protein n=1 Tax=Gossypium arboreum TaxID=29729 RepID=A0ABR0MGH8_GOSAR|nr:hypothetical protein PVK06_047916 [Gossypium arboreum]